VAETATSGAAASPLKNCLRVRLIFGIALRIV
jgi:hypothetical protein